MPAPQTQNDPLNLFPKEKKDIFDRVTEQQIATQPDVFDRISQPSPQIKNDPLGLFAPSPLVSGGEFDYQKARAAGYSKERIDAYLSGESPVLSGDPRDFIKQPSADIFDTPPQFQPSELEETPPKRPIGATGSFAPETPLEEAAGRLGGAVAGAAREFGLGVSLGYADLYDVFPGLEQFEQKYQQNIPIQPNDPVLLKIEKYIRNDPAILAKMPARLLGAILPISRISKAVSATRGLPQGIREIVKSAAITGGIVGGIRKPEVEEQVSFEALGERVKNAVVDAAFFAATTGLVLGVNKVVQNWRVGKLKSIQELRESMYKTFIDDRGLARNNLTMKWTDDVLNDMAASRGGLQKMSRARINTAIQRVKSMVAEPSPLAKEAGITDVITPAQVSQPGTPLNLPSMAAVATLPQVPPAVLTPGFTPAGEALRQSIPREPEIIPPDEIGAKPQPAPKTTPQAKKRLSPTETKEKQPFLPDMRELTLEMKAGSKFPGVERSFLKQPKVKTDILQYLTPAEYHLKELGFDAKIGQPVREALQDFSIELMKKNDLVIQAQANHYATLKRRNSNWRKLTKKKPLSIEQSNDMIFQMVDKGIPATGQSIEARTARIYRPETEEMLTRMNEVRVLVGLPPITGLKNYILHAIKPEILNEIYSKGVIPPELAKVMQHIPNKNLFLRTAQQRKGVPEEWLIKNPHQLMKMMYAIDLRYIHLQKALHQIEPYMKAVKGFAEPTPEGGVDEWSPETYKYLDDWIKQAIKMRPSNLDTLFDNLLEATLAPILRRGGIKVSHMPWRDAVNFLSASVHTGALGLRAKPVLRNLVQSSFDWVMYGTKAYAKGSTAFMTPEGHKILKKSKIWQTRMPFEAQDLATLQKVFKAGSYGYRMADLHNVGKGILTRYYHAIDALGKSPTEAIKWADLDLPGTQWSYRREDLPRVYWTTTGRAVWTLGSWWMNFYTRLLPEILNKTFKGIDVTGREVPLVERMSGIRFLALIGLLYGIKEKSKELIGTNIDYTGSVQPTPLGGSPIFAIGQAAQKITAGLTTKRKWIFKKGLSELKRTSKIFVPFYLAAEEYYDYWTGKKTGGELLFYGSDKKGLTLEDIVEELPFVKREKIFWKDILKGAKAKGVSQEAVRKYMKKNWKTRKYGDLSREARRELLQRFSPEK